MKLDNEEQRIVILECVEKSLFPGVLSEKVSELKEALRRATIEQLKTGRKE